MICYRFRIPLCLTATAAVLTYLTFYNETPSEPVPNTVHYIIFKNEPLSFIEFLSITSAIKVQRPESVNIHSDYPQVFSSGRYWVNLVKLSSLLNVPLVLHETEPPSHVFGQRLSSVYHSSDVARIVVLQKYGGIYLDTDSLILKPLNEFFKFEITLGWPDGDLIGNQVIVAQKNAKFLQYWLEGYKTYKPTMWYYNAGQYPTEILQLHPHLIHRVKNGFGVANLLKQLYEMNWDGWRRLYTVHLLSRHPPAPAVYSVNEKFIKTYNQTFGAIGRYILYELPPSLDNLSEE